MDLKKLSPWAHQAEAYWRKFRPKLYQALKEKGQLEQALQEAADPTGEVYSELLAKGLQHHEAWELVREEWLFPPGEEESPLPDPDESA